MLVPSDIKQIATLRGHPYYRKDTTGFVVSLNEALVEDVVVADAINGYVKFLARDPRADEPGDFLTCLKGPLHHKVEKIVILRRKGRVFIMQDTSLPPPSPA